MHANRTQEPFDEPTCLEQAILELILDPDTQRPWSDTEITRAISTPGDVSSALKRLRLAGLIHRWAELVSPARAAIRFHEIEQSTDPGSEYERRHERSVLELLLSESGEQPMSEKEIRRALGASKKTKKLAVIDALSRLDGAGLVDRRGDLAVASPAARRIDCVMAL